VNRKKLSHSMRAARAALGLGAVALALAGCGGGGSSPAAPVSTTTSVPVIVIDGAIKGAVVCLDKNGNGICDAGEPTGTTDASGNVTLTVDNADAGMFPVVVMVGTDAVDADTGPVPVAFVMQAPADQVSVVSPLTTIVQAQIASSGGTSAQAAAIVQSQTGLTVSLFSNYTTTESTSADASAAADLARLIVLASQQQSAALASVVGQTDLSGAVVSQADLQAAVVKSLVGSLPALAAAAADPTVAAASTPAARDAALATLATTLIADGQAGLTPSTALVAVGVAKLPPDVAAVTPQAGATLRALTFTDANDWFFRAMEASATDNTPDANGLVHFYDNRTQDVAGTVSTWGLENTIARQGDLHWDGTVWAGCPFGFRSSQAPRDANGITHYNYCDNLETGVSQRFAVDISGKTLSSVVATIQAFPGGDSGIAYASFGPTDSSLLGSAAFPAGSSLFYQANQTATEAIGYDVTSIVNGYAVDIAAGGDATASPPPACAVLTVANAASYYKPVGTLDELIAATLGQPCTYGPTTNGMNLPNEGWGVSTVSIGSIANALTPPDPTYFKTTELLRVAFVPAGNVAIYLSCLDRLSDGSTRNCTELGRGTYAIQTLGDGRVLTTTNPPPEVLRLGYTRVFVERGGNVYYGYQTVPGAKSTTVRLNLAAANALLAQLGIPVLTP
jgi:hypothetical protein